MLVMMVLCLGLSGCSVWMAASGHKEPNLGAFNIGSTRGQVEQQLGTPKSTVTLDDGCRQDTYEYKINAEPAPGRAVAHGVADVLTLGIWEVVGTPVEAANLGDKKQMIITYDSENKVRRID
jgi:hypothetical protein